MVAINEDDRAVRNRDGMECPMEETTIDSINIAACVACRNPS